MEREHLKQCTAEDETSLVL